MERNKKITKLFDKILSDYKQTEITCIMEFPCSDEKKALEDLDKKIANQKKKLQTLLKQEI